MRIEKLGKGKSKKIVIVVSIIVLAIGIIYITNSKAKYQVTKSVQIVNGTINYSRADFSLLGVYQQHQKDSTTYDSVNNIPTSGYVLNETKTYCTIGSAKYEGKINYNEQGITINYNGGSVTFDGVKTTNTKCYLYFDILNNILPADRVVAMGKSKQVGQTSFTVVDTANNSGKMYSGTDNDGTTYYFRGVVNDNWVRYGTTYDNKSIWWRIIRINGDGTIRLIYAGTTDLNSNTPPETTGTGTQITVDGANTVCYGTSDCQNKNNKYLGYQYADSDVHGKEKDSYAADRANEWFRLNLEDEWNNGNGKIDKDAGFCADRNVAVGHSNYPGDGLGTNKTVYMPANRFNTTNLNGYKTSQSPIFRCTNASDLFTYTGATKGTQSLTYPVGLITADEVVYAGGFGGGWGEGNNTSYYLYTRQDYWTMSPSNFSGSASGAIVFIVNAFGTLTDANVGNAPYGVRPVINLKAYTIFTGTGKSGSPFVPE